MVNEKLKAARLQMGLSQADLAKLVNVARQTINMIEKSILMTLINI